MSNDDPENESHLNGRTTLLTSILAHSPIDHVLLMLGTNSVKYRMNLSASRIYDQLIEVASIISTSKAGANTWHDNISPTVTIIYPPILGMRADYPNWIGFSEQIRGAEKSRVLRRLLRDASAISKFDHFDSNTVVVSSDTDPIHLSADNYIKFGEKMAEHILRFQKR